MAKQEKKSAAKRPRKSIRAKKDGEQTNLYLDKETKGRLLVLAKESRRSLSAYLEVLIEAEYERTTKKAS